MLQQLRHHTSAVIIFSIIIISIITLLFRSMFVLLFDTTKQLGDGIIERGRQHSNCVTIQKAQPR